MANDIVQTITDARIDARSLSEFMFKPASYMIARRLAPPVHTLDYYLDYLDGLEAGYRQIDEDVKDLKNSRAIAQPITQPRISEDLHAYVNGLEFAKDLDTPLKVMTTSAENIAHTPTMLEYSNVVYSVYMVNRRGLGEAPKQMTISFQHMNINNPEVVTYYDICDIGDVFLGRTVTEVYDSVIFLKDGLIYILWNVKFDGDSFYSILNQTFNPITKQFGNPRLSRFKVGATVVDMTGSAMNSALDDEGIAGSRIPLHIVIMSMSPYASKTEGSTKYYYTGIGSSGDFNILVKTSDFITWTYVSRPSFEESGQFEPTTFVQGTRVYYYCRQQPSQSGGFLTYYNIVANTWEVPVYIEDCQSRSQFFLYKSELYLIYAPEDRHHTGIIRINRNDLKNSKVIQVAKNDGEYSYHSVISYQDRLFTMYSDTKERMLFAEFEMNKHTDASIDAAMRTLFNV